MQYPENTLRKLGKIVMSMDFIGPKFLTGNISDILKVDNDAAFGAHSTHKESIGRLTIFLLNLGVAPLYTAPRNPWNNGEVEGFNCIFATKFWNRTRFNNEDEIDVDKLIYLQHNRLR